jgi:hypothetical protein
MPQGCPLLKKVLDNLPVALHYCDYQSSAGANVWWPDLWVCHQQLNHCQLAQSCSLIQSILNDIMMVALLQQQATDIQVARGCSYAEGPPDI